jgi:tetratricopeptide (TPR) repeat protein
LRVPGIANARADVKRLVKARLSDEGSEQWLMVIDNADDVGVLFDPLENESGASRLIDYLPHSRKGSIIFTTRTRKAAIDLAGSTVVELGELNDQEAREMLGTRLLPEHQHQLKNGRIVLEFLDMLTFLALAIVQAVTFINKNNTTLSDYVSMYRESEKVAIDLLSKEFEDQGRYGDTKNPVATTWFISFKQIQSQNMLAAEYLFFMACTTGENMPASLLLPASTKLATAEAIGTLDAYAFVKERPQQQQQKEGQYHKRAFDIHRPVRLATRNWLRGHNEWEIWAHKALTRLVEVVPLGGHDKSEVWTAYLPHAIHVVGVPEIYEVEARMSLLDRIGKCEQILGRYKVVELAYRQLSERLEKESGKEHPYTLTSMNSLAHALSGQGKYAEAEKMHRETLELKEKVLGKERPETLTSMNNVAQALSGQGKYAEAEEMHRETLALREKVLGKEHPHTLTSIYCLGWSLYRREQYEDALPLCHRAYTSYRMKLGPGHPTTQACLNRYSSIQQQCGYEPSEGNISLPNSA